MIETESIKCGLCGFEYDADEAQTACKSCPVLKGCKLIRCPRCGYETPPEPRWLKSLLKRGDKNESK